MAERTHFAATSGAADAHIPPTAVRVLIVEDNAADAEYVAELLELTEHGDVEVRVATTLADALEQLVEMPDCALLDLGLPDTAGLEGVLELSRHAPGLPIVVLSGQSDRAIAMQAVKHGAQDYLNKGAIDGDNVLRAIRYAIERKRTEHTLQRLATQDQLTGLANRALFVEHLTRAVDRRRSQVPLAVLFIDLDGFKEINDGLGHAAGDLLLAEVGAVLVATLRPEDTVARFGGDEFAVLCEQIAEPKMAEQIAARVVRAVGLLSSPQRAISASVGVALSVGAEKISAATLLAEADEAMYLAKRQGKAHVAVQAHPTAPRGDGAGEPGRLPWPFADRPGREGLHDLHALLRATFDDAPGGIAIVERRADDTIQLIRVNVALCALTGYDEAELLRRGVAALGFAPEPASPGSVEAWRLVHADGSDRRVLVARVALLDGTAGESRRAVWHISDSTAHTTPASYPGGCP
jgi:diguanylate cyclase (GGDEF)-like protein